MRSPRSRRLIDRQVNAMLPRIPGFPRPFGLRREVVVLVAGAAYFAGEHEQGRHTRPNLLCLICWLNRVAPAPEATGGASPTGNPPGQAGPGQSGPEQAGPEQAGPEQAGPGQAG
jgi:hypothetical protein